MHAVIGERIVVRATHVGDTPRDAEILEVRGADGQPPYLVRWSGDGHTGLFFPSSDAFINHLHSANPAATVVGPVRKTAKKRLTRSTP